MLSRRVSLPFFFLFDIQFSRYFWFSTFPDAIGGLGMVSLVTVVSRFGLVVPDIILKYG